MPKKPTKMSISDKIDELGALREEAAVIEQKMNEIKAWLKEQGVDKAEGVNYKVSFTHLQTQRVNWKKVQEDYDIPTEEYLEATTSVRMNLSKK